VSPERLRNQVKAKGAIRKKGNRWTIIKKLPRTMLIYSNGEALPITLDKLSQASKVGRYMSAVSKFIRTNNPSGLTKFSKKYTEDIKGKKYVFETNPNTLYRLVSSGMETFEQVYRIVI
jgi:outer membrane lipoprotein-sorting protein